MNSKELSNIQGVCRFCSQGLYGVTFNGAIWFDSPELCVCSNCAKTELAKVLADSIPDISMVAVQATILNFEREFWRALFLRQQRESLNAFESSQEG